MTTKDTRTQVDNSRFNFISEKVFEFPVLHPCPFLAFLCFVKVILFSVFNSHVIKTKNRNHSIKKSSRISDMIADCNINNLAENQVYAVFHTRAIRRSVSPKFIELCKQTPCLCPSEEHKHGGRDVTKTSVVEFCSNKCIQMLFLVQAPFRQQKLKR